MDKRKFEKMVEMVKMKKTMQYGEGKERAEKREMETGKTKQGRLSRN